MQFSMVSSTELDKWTVKDKAFTHDVTKINNTCPENCELVCAECSPRTCTHMFTCTCTDYLVQGTLCKHIHLIQRFAQASKTANDDTQDYDYCQNNNNEELEFIKSCVKVPSSNINAIKNRIKDKILSLSSMINSSTNSDALRYLEKKVEEASSMFVTLNNQPTVEKLELTQEYANAPANKKMETQPNFFSTKKKRVQSKVRYAKPSTAEVLEFINSFSGRDIIPPGRLKTLSC